MNNEVLEEGEVGREEWIMKRRCVEIRKQRKKES